MQNLFTRSNKEVLILGPIRASIPDGNRILGLPTEFRD
jgi:hypothetical protein